MTATPRPEPAPAEIFDFVGSQGSVLSARLHRPAPGTARGSVLLAHCFTCTKDIHTMTRLAEGLAEAGFAALRFDFTGMGESGGDFATKTLSGNVSDLTRAAAALITAGFGPCGLIGHSLGGAAAVLATHRLKTVDWLVTIGAPSDPAHVCGLFRNELDQLHADGRADVTIGGRTFELDRGFVDDIVGHDVLALAAELDRPYLVLHARDDEVVDFEHAEALFAAAKEPKRLVALDTGGHMLAPRSASAEALDAILAFVDDVTN